MDQENSFTVEQTAYTLLCANDHWVFFVYIVYFYVTLSKYLCLVKHSIFLSTFYPTLKSAHSKIKYNKYKTHKNI